RLRLASRRNPYLPVRADVQGTALAVSGVPGRQRDAQGRRGELELYPGKISSRPHARRLAALVQYPRGLGLLARRDGQGRSFLQRGSGNSLAIAALPATQ